ncbi:hypothetical protein BDZ45DRAFT_144890 [Acephala macrosclerotiorum]|nr:hypothetical protein BDZ45DRAFT_144890 [Acephala macrosclerotiorum]
MKREGIDSRGCVLYSNRIRRLRIVERRKKGKTPSQQIKSTSLSIRSSLSLPLHFFLLLQCLISAPHYMHEICSAISEYPFSSLLSKRKMQEQKCTKSCQKQQNGRMEKACKQCYVNLFMGSTSPCLRDQGLVEIF